MRAAARVEDETVHVTPTCACCRGGEQLPSPPLESAHVPDALHNSVRLRLPSDPSTPGQNTFLSLIHDWWCEPFVGRSAAQLRRTSDRQVVCGHGARIRTLT